MDFSPLFEPLLYLKKEFSNFQHWPEHEELNKLCSLRHQQIYTRSGKSICFIPQVLGKRHQTQDYESKIYLTGQVQTRASNWHDFFNALVWQLFPRAKSALNQLHYQAQLFELTTEALNRSPLRDAATLFDESGVVIISSQEFLIQLIKDFEWKELFWRQRTAVLSSMRFIIFGHGMYEKALNPYVGMTGKAIIFKVRKEFFLQELLGQLNSVDVMLEQFLLCALSTSTDLTPVPVLGYPGWDAGNCCESYYENKKYFRERCKSK
ncbi:DUF3025 domain-containing protein [Nitrosomonas supralitoralis]|uniref:DUF3025 domain-containing protein n=1 Tax=Nitrosomonas supralitoralis TaxID=2116706 RepID=A0A2P7NV73_9PROT|nr:DUF3025 domain-containing protein [Nitrosomonas supralitoralis]PSJ17367.1 DUF3025 domain-containing protein [Nitrosomonas supralitoralis]